MLFQGFWWVPWVCLPLIAANMLPVLLGRGAKPLEQYSWWPKRWPLGLGKTLKGFVGGWLVGVYATRVLAIIMAIGFNNRNLVEIWNFNEWRSWKIMLAMGFGALLGDLIKSIIKRRRGFRRGDAWWPWDQMDAVIGGFTLTSLADWSWFYQNLIIRWQSVAAWIVIYLIVHPVLSRLAHWFKLKSVPH